MSRSQNPPEIEESAPDQLLAALEPDQLAKAKQHFPRRPLKGREVLLLWSLRVYLVFMAVVVLYQIWSSTK